MGEMPAASTTCSLFSHGGVIVATVVAIVVLVSLRSAAAGTGAVFVAPVDLAVRRVDGILTVGFTFLLMCTAYLPGAALASLKAAFTAGASPVAATRRPGSCWCGQGCSVSMADAVASFQVQPTSLHAWLRGKVVRPDSAMLLALLRTYWGSVGALAFAAALLKLLPAFDPKSETELAIDVSLLGAASRPLNLTSPLLLHALDHMLWEMQGSPALLPPAEPGRRCRCPSLRAVLLTLGHGAFASGVLLLMFLVRFVLFLSGVVPFTFAPMLLSFRFIEAFLLTTFYLGRRSTVMRALLSVALPLGLACLAFMYTAGTLGTAAVSGAYVGQGALMLIIIANAMLLPTVVYVLHLSAGAQRAVTLLGFLRYMSHEVRVPANVGMLAVDEALMLIEPGVTDMEPVASALPAPGPPSLRSRGFSSTLHSASSKAGKPDLGPVRTVTAESALSPRRRPSDQSAPLEALPLDTVKECRNALVEARDALAHMQVVLTRTLDLASLDVGRLRLALRPVFLPRLWRRLRVAATPVFQTAEVTLDMPPLPEEWQNVWVVGDGLRIQQAVLGILVNAAHHAAAHGSASCHLRLLEVAAGQRQLFDPSAPPPAEIAQQASSRRLALVGAAATALDDSEVVSASRELVLEVEVSDDGRGMTPQEQLNVFVPFSRLHSGEEGTGLGLNIAKKAMQAHGGDVLVFSEGLGRGSTFTLHALVGLHHVDAPDVERSTTSTTSGASRHEGDEIEWDVGQMVWRPTLGLSSRASGDVSVDGVDRGDSGSPRWTGPGQAGKPVQTAPPPPTTVPETGPLTIHSSQWSGQGTSSVAQAPSVRPSGASTVDPQSSRAAPSHHVLVVDDDVPTRRMLARLLARVPTVASVVTAKDGREAVELWMAAQSGPAPFTHITLDNQMPILTGVQCAIELRSLGCKARIVGVSGNVIGRDRQEFLGAGVDVVLGKPAHRTALLEALKL